MASPVTQDTFAEQHQHWLAAHASAAASEQALSLALDRYCEGTGPAPPLAEADRVHELREEASGAWGQLCARIHQLRQRLELL